MSGTHNNERPQHQIVLGHKGNQNPQGTSLLANLSSNDEIIQVCYVFFSYRYVYTEFQTSLRVLTGL